MCVAVSFWDFFTACPVSYAGTPVKGKPNSTQETYNRDGTVKRRRQFDEKGRAKKDIDYNHGGEHTFPHVHDWEWNEEKFKRKDPREPKEGELEAAEKITTAATL